MTINFQGKTALVTGAGSGIGAACAHKFAQCGAYVFVNDIDPVRAESVAKEIGGTALAGDVASPGAWLDPVLERGELHALVHNAGYDLATRMGSTEMAAFDRLHRIQISGPFEMTQLLLPVLRAANGAIVIFVASVHGIATEPETSAYAAAKGALIAMVRSLCQDLGPDRIRALTVSPGYVDTPLLDLWMGSTPDPAATRAHAESLHPLGRMGQPEEIASLIAFLASPYAEFINGTNIVIDGGLTARLMD